jgi:mannitol-1-/sugar-/sorbitol-6-phosphatase
MIENTGLLFSCDAVLFDFDGVLIDSTGNILRHWKVWADRHSIDMDEINRAIHGMRAIETMRIVAPHLDHEKEARLFMENELNDFEGITAYEGAIKLLSSLPEDSWAVVTSARKELVQRRMSKTGLPVPRVLIAADDVNEGKPSPEPYLTGARKIGVPPETCIVIEDAPAGIEAGKKAGMRVIAIASTHSRDDLQKTGADCIVDRLADLRITPGSDGAGLGIQVSLVP